MPLTYAHKGCYPILAMPGKSSTVFANASAAVPACGLLCENAQRLPDFKSCLAFVFWSSLPPPVSYRGLTPPFCRTAACPRYPVREGETRPHARVPGGTKIGV